MTVATRQALVRQLIEQDPTLSTRAIAAQVGVGKDTVRRDLDAIRQSQQQAAPQPAADEPDPAPDGDCLVLVLDAPLRHALAVLRAGLGAPDTERQNRAAARAAIRSVADTLLEEQHHQEGPSNEPAP
ncbi:DeoR family transcriptional regulator [Streptomyces sp. NPDC048415]|uniref:DeoR family transcriptional regulator n=1 Tax=Streptomyces sp. NPDC048415 TaxID=3154822 RepID=UPI00342973B0